MGLFDQLEKVTAEITKEQPVVRAPFGYVGSKLKGAKHILPMLPYRKSYIEVFGGSGVVLINRGKSELDVYNDRFGGVVCFYRCIRDAKKMDALIERLELTVQAKEEYIWCRQTWRDCEDEIERAARWYQSVVYSFGNKGDAWGRTVNSSSLAGGIQRRLQQFERVHNRFKDVQIENASWEVILRDYDNKDAVFYLDPPYVATDSGGYHFSMSVDEHKAMLDTIMEMKGFVALSGFSNPFYEDYGWDNRISWKQTCSLAGNANTAGNNKEHLAGLEAFHSAEEVLWIKEC